MAHHEDTQQMEKHLKKEEHDTTKVIWRQLFKLPQIDDLSCSHRDTSCGHLTGRKTPEEDGNITQRLVTAVVVSFS